MVLLCVSTMPEDNGVGDFCWDTLGLRALHPARVEIIEALRWIDQSLSAADLVPVFEGRRLGLRLEYHLWRLCKLGVVKTKGDEGVAPRGQPSYRLVQRP
jgi:hypothetical protein